jgi:hypothetical protein
MRFKQLMSKDARRDAKSSAGRNKYLEPLSLLVPPALPVWRDALMRVDTREENRLDHGSTSYEECGFAFPDPGLFPSIQTDEKRARFLYNWIRNRTALIYRFTSSSSSARPLSNRRWRALLNYGSTAECASSSGSTKSSQLRLEMRELLGSCLDEAGVALDISSASPDVFWRETRLSAGTMPDIRITQEILWELYELNFRFELIALDKRAWLAPEGESAAEESTRQMWLMACFPNNALVVDVSHANRGLASPTLANRGLSLIAMKRLMKMWTGNVPAVICDPPKNPAKGYSLEEFGVLEVAVASFYTQSFFNHFGRAAILPHTLGHTVAQPAAL